MTEGFLVVCDPPLRGLAVQPAAWGAGWERRGPLLLRSRQVTQDPWDRTPAVRQAQGSIPSITLFHFGWRMVKEGQPASGWGPARARWSQGLEVGKPGLDFGRTSLDCSWGSITQDPKLWAKKVSVILFVRECQSLGVC